MRAVFLIVLGIVIGNTLSTMIALAWNAPTASPPGNNVSAPINTGATSQLKNGTLGVNGLGVFGNTILSGANGDNNGNGVNSYLNFGATAGQNGYGIRDNNGTLEFKNNSSSWGSFNVTLANLMQVNGITPNGLGQITSIKFADGTTQSTAATANPWSTNGTSIYYNGGNVGIGTNNPISPLTIQTSGETSDNGDDIAYTDYTNTYTPALAFNRARGTVASPAAVQNGDYLAGWTAHPYTGSGFGAAGATISFIAEANATASSYPTGISFATTPANSTVGSERLRIAANGNVGIGTAVPDAVLQVAGGIHSNSVGIGVVATHALQISIDDAFKPNGGSWGNSSDARLKTHITPINDALAKLTKLQGVTYDWINPSLHGGMTSSGGFIAQNVAKVFPDFVKEAACAGADCALVGGASSSKEYTLSLPFTFDAYVVEAIKEIASLSGSFKQTLIAFLGSASNGISDLYASIGYFGEVHAADKLCVGSGSSETCITQQQLAALLANHTTCKTQ